MELTIDDKDTSIIKDASIVPTYYVELNTGQGIGREVGTKRGERGKEGEREGGREGRRERGGRRHTCCG